MREAVGVRGVLGALAYYAGGGFELLRDLTPERRRSRFGDIEYDFDHGVDTTWATVSLRTRIRELLSGGQYQPSEPELFHQILQAVPAELDGFTFIDLGSGKGRTLLMASDYRFARIIGVELLEELDVIARRTSRGITESSRSASRWSRMREMQESLCFRRGRWWCTCSIRFRSMCCKLC